MKLNHLDRAQLDARLLEESPEFTAAYSRFPATHWSRYDLAAVRLGWELAREDAEARAVVPPPRSGLLARLADRLIARITRSGLLKVRGGE